MVSLWFLVTITVLLSTRATSFGSVRASQLRGRQELERKADREEGASGGVNLLVPVLIFGKPLDHPFLLQTCQDIGCFLRRTRHHVHVGGLAFFHRSLHKVSHRRRQRGDGGQGTDADACPNAAMSGGEQSSFTEDGAGIESCFCAKTGDVKRSQQQTSLQ